MIKYANISSKYQIKPLKDKVNWIIPLNIRNCFISITPPNNITYHNYTLEILLENTETNKIIDALCIKIPQNQNNFFKVRHSSGLIFPYSTQEYNDYLASMKNEYYKDEQYFAILLTALKRLVDQSYEHKINKQLFSRTATIHKDDNPKKLKDAVQYVINLDNSIKCFILIWIDYLDDVLDIALQLESNDTILDRMWLSIPQQPNDFITVEHDENMEIPGSDEFNINYNQRVQKYSDRENRFNTIMQSLKRLII